MSSRTKWISVALIAVFILGLFWVAGAGYTVNGTGQENNSIFSSPKTTLYLWYSDDTLTDYLNQAAVAYNETDSDYRVEPLLKDGVEFLEAVNTASVGNESDMPDLYIIGDSSLGRAYLSGLASEIQDTTEFADTSVFPQPAINAVTYGGKVVAYPLCFETAALLYNTDLLSGMADELGKTADEIIPHTIADIITLADQYNAPEGVTSVWGWDVNDIFYNYYFVGNSISVGGPDGDDSTAINLYNEDTIRELQVYQDLNQYFSIDTATSNYDAALSDFAAGHTVFTVATTDAVKTLSDAKASGSFTSDYGVESLPNITDELETKGLSVTECLVINGYSEHPRAAEAFIRFLESDAHSSDFYDRTGYAFAKNGYVCSDEHMEGFYEAYADSVAGTKLPEAENFWMLLENTMAKVWDGGDPNSLLRELTQQVLVQVSGDESTVVDPIDSPEPITFTSPDSETEEEEGTETSEGGD